MHAGLGPDLEEPLVLGDDELDHSTQPVTHRHVHGVVDGLTLPHLGSRNVIKIYSLKKFVLISTILYILI